jgi:hypothetical protein
MTQHNTTPFISKRPRYSNKRQKLIDLSLAEKITLIFFAVYFGGHVLLWVTINLFKGQ